jgi:hypothetical protein
MSVDSKPVLLCKGAALGNHLIAIHDALCGVNKQLHFWGLHDFGELLLVQLHLNPGGLCILNAVLLQVPLFFDHLDLLCRVVELVLVLHGFCDFKGIVKHRRKAVPKFKVVLQALPILGHFAQLSNYYVVLFNRRDEQVVIGLDTLQVLNDDVRFQYKNLVRRGANLKFN